MMPIERRKSQQPFSGPERRKGPGRPRLREGEDTYNVSLRMPVSQYDRICREALREDVSVNEIIRRKLDPLMEEL